MTGRNQRCTGRQWIQRIGDQREPIRDSFHGGAKYFDWLSRRRQAINGSSHSFVPARASLSKPEGKHRQTMLIRRHASDFIFNRLLVNVIQKRISKPTVQVSTV